MKAILHKAGQRLLRIKYVRRAVEDRADLSEFRKPPTLRILTGVFLITVSLICCWPVIVASIGWLAWHLHRPWILALIIPLYILSHVCYLTGMFLCGEKYARIFLRWLTRRAVERLLGHPPENPKPFSPSPCTQGEGRGENSPRSEPRISAEQNQIPHQKSEAVHSSF